MTDIELYNAAKEAYYKGEPIMTDIEFDELERKIGLENKAYIGTKHNPSYTVQHPFIMGSLSKVQIKEAKDNGGIDWGQYYNEASAYMFRNGSNHSFIVTPKYDGCSFEAIIENHQIVSISTRGDGTWGKDIKQHLISKFDNSHLSLPGLHVLRGEVLVRKDVFEQKYSEFVNPRSFVAGILNRDYNSKDEEMMSMLKDLSIVIYDVRVKAEDGWKDLDWNNWESVGGKISHIPEFYTVVDKMTKEQFIETYKIYAQYRQTAPFALDGIVIKPVSDARMLNLDQARPKDCIAIKFVPMLSETTISNIEWSLSKKGEYVPVINVEPVVMDGKTVTRASAHNYGYVLDKQLSAGVKVVLSLAGDIIPFIYKVTDTSRFDKDLMYLPEGNTWIDGCHLYKEMTEDERRELYFVQSAEALSIPNIGPAAAQNIYKYMVDQYRPDDFLGLGGQEVPDNILCCSSADISSALGGKTGAAAMKAFDKFKSELSLSDIILSCCFESCGQKAAEAVQRYLLSGTASFEHLSEKSWRWAMDNSSKEMQRLNKVLESCGKTMDMFRQELAYKDTVKGEQIPVILTGEPNGYATKDAFLREHPEYRLTTSWKEVKIVFTNSMDSNTGKMKKAREKNIEIRIY